MKKLKLEHYNIKDAKILSREQLKSILGGDGSGGQDPCAGKSDFEGYCRNSQGTLLGIVTPSSCKRQDMISACEEYTGFRIDNSSCSCW